MRKKEKRAQGHVEVMISFVIFIGFLIFTFIFLNPFAKTEEPNYIMDNAQKGIINNISDSVGKLSIILNVNGTCYYFNEADYDGDYQEVQESNIKYTIYFNDIFNNNATIKNINCNQTNYTLGVYSKEEMILEDNLKKLKTSYEMSDDSYDNLKENLGITNDFLFKTRDLLENETAELSVDRNIPQGIDVESRDIPVRVINNNGQIQELILNIRVW
ncbi:MAG: hypothetical protein PHH54_04905 [Candidatus Nanoarchaeia archaeon]|nr:hypothetical protein [Candidatus Nanoarchaeia archaeon]MDD5741297.1 hypothetical protein [Candidatus Nanoarchaeia archaeon]